MCEEYGKFGGRGLSLRLTFLFPCLTVLSLGRVHGVGHTTAY